MPTEKPKTSRELDVAAQFQSYISGVRKPTDTQSKPKQVQATLCACGAQNPMHNGYCTSCVKILKTRYDELLEQLAQVQTLHDDFNDAEVDRADEKLKLMKAKVEQFEIKICDAQMIDVLARYEQIADSEENRQLAENRVIVQAMQQEQQILIFKKQIEQDDYQK